MMSTDLIGKHVNGYEILSQVGQGGMATVFLARQRSMNRNVALKFLPAVFLNDDSYLQRFEREVKIVARLEHRNIVPVYDYGEFDQQPYIAMRYMPAGSVEELLAKGKIPLRRVASIIEQVASALDYAHQMGILHRDLKPSNILLDDGGGVFITDFGIAQILSEGSGKITTQGAVGTPSYMSPEQARGEPLDGRSDVYSLGVMLFELLTGRRPFESDTPYSIAVMHVTTPPPSPREIEPSVSAALEAVIMRALRKDPAQRYASAGALASDLNAALADSLTSEERTDAPPSRPTGALTAEGVASPKTTPGSMPAATPLPAQNPSQASPLLQRRPGRRRASFSIAAGGLLGCAILTALILLAVLAFGFISRDARREATATSLPAVGPVETARAADRTVPKQQATPQPGRAPDQVALDALNAAADATFTAEALGREAQATPGGIQPVGLRGKPELNEALQAVSGELVYFAKSDASDESDPVFEIVTLDLETWETRRFGAGGGSSTYPQPSPDGRWIAFQSDRDGDFDIYLSNRFGGQLLQLTHNAIWDRLPAWAPAGDWIVYSSDTRRDESLDLYRLRAIGTERQPFYSDGWRNSHARYSPDGNYVVFTSGPGVRDASTWEIRLFDRRNGQSRLLTQNAVRDASPTFSPDSQRILYVTTIAGERALANMNLQGEEREALYTGPGRVWSASYSPDGQFIVATATQNGDDQLFLMTADGGSAQQITTGGGAYASWIPKPADA